MVSVLFAHSDSYYFNLDGVDVFDKKRNALTYKGGTPIVAHPPCRAWGRLRWNAKPELGEKDLAIWAVNQIRRFGGVLEHPESSQLWKELSLPFGRNIDQYGGFTLSVDQFWFGHRSRKRTWLYIVGIKPSDVPPYPIKLDAITHTVGSSMRRKRGWYKPKPEITKAERELTPPLFAEWLVSLARLCSRQYYV